MENNKPSDRQPASIVPSLHQNGINKQSGINFDLGDILRTLGTIAGLVGVGAALLLLLGRYYYYGIFSSKNLPTLLISLENQDYLDSGAPIFVFLLIDILISALLYYLAVLARVLFYENVGKRLSNRVIYYSTNLLIFAICIVGGVYAISITGLGVTFDFFFEQISNILGFFLIFLGLEVAFLIATPTSKSIDIQLSEPTSAINLQAPISILRILILVVIISSLIFSQTLSAYINGYINGCLTTLNQSTTVILFSEKSLLIEGKSQVQGQYFYDGYFLLFIDRNNYYIYREINKDTQKPNGYFLVSRESIDTIKISTLPISDDVFKGNLKLCQNIFSQ